MAVTPKIIVVHNETPCSLLISGQSAWGGGAEAVFNDENEV
jgi:hypothetical protein